MRDHTRRQIKKLITTRRDDLERRFKPPPGPPPSGWVQPCAAANPAIGSRLQSHALVGRVAELGSLGGFTRMETEKPDPSWKAQLRYGKIKTPFHHFTLLAEGTVGQLADGFVCPPGSAFMGMKTWASSEDESFDMIRVIGQHIGFTVTGKIYLYVTEPSEPPKDKPHGYDINFTPFNPAA